MRDPAHSLWLGLVLLVGAAGVAPGCTEGFFGAQDAEPQRYARIVLVPDERLNSAAELSALVRRVELTFDSPSGFDGVNREGERLGELEAIQADQDEALELVTRLSLEEPFTLPVVLLTPGQNGDRAIGINARGFDGADQPVAAGKLEPRVLFPSDQEELVSISFNFNLPTLRAPSLVGFAPAAIQSGTLGSVAFYLSKAVPRESLEGQLELTWLDGSGAETPIPFALGDPRDCPFGKQMWTLTPTECLTLPASPLRLTLTIPATVLDERGFAIRGVNGTAGVSYQAPDLAIQSFGPCSPTASCANAMPLEANHSDLSCNGGTGRWEAASCSLVSAGCLGPFQEFAWYTVADDFACQAIRTDTLWVQAKGQCAIIEPSVFSCIDHTDCNAIFSDKCTGKICSSISEVGGECPNKDWIYTATKGCRPRIGGCREDCAASSTCGPESP